MRRILIRTFRVFQFLILPVFVVLFGLNVFTSFFLQANLKNPEDLMDRDLDEVFNPYPPNKNSMKWKKIGIHIHSDRVWYTPEREATEDLVKSYRRNGFDWMALSDYGLVSDIRDLMPNTFDSYEFGGNLQKRHFLVIGTKHVDPDPFFFYSLSENIQWLLDRFQRRKAFVVVNHPRLYKAFSVGELVEVFGYHAIEVFTPYGELTDFYDQLLRAGVPSFGMSSDDLHYLPQGELALNQESWVKKFWKFASLVYGRDGLAFQHYIRMPLSDTASEGDFYKNLCEGKYIFVKKLHRDTKDLDIRRLEFVNDTLTIELGMSAKEILFYTGKESPVARYENVNRASYTWKPDDAYIRLEVRDWLGLMGTNPVFRRSKMRKLPGCVL